jgi:hydroxyethylthiazole kinase-like uncharacterized protein yjeF
MNDSSEMTERIPILTPQPLIQRQVMANFPQRPRDSHKGLFGKVVVIGGADGMIGAAFLAARAALKMGAGCVHVGLVTENAPGVDFLQPEIMLHSATVALQLREVNLLAIGCGMGADTVAHKFLNAALNSDTPLVLDADALNILTQRPDFRAQLSLRNAACVLTPHPGEAARLLACSIKDIQTDRVTAVQKIAQIFNCSVVLKGADSVCVTRDGHLYVNTTGNPGMSSAGMGDVLTGMIAGFIAQGMTADDAFLLAVYLHGAAADALVNQSCGIGMTATEVVEQARYLLNQWMTDD